MVSYRWFLIKRKSCNKHHQQCGKGVSLLKAVWLHNTLRLITVLVISLIILIINFTTLHFMETYFLSVVQDLHSTVVPRMHV